MDKSFKFRRVNEITGAFVMLTAALLVAGILLAGRAQQWFEPQYEVSINYPIEGSLGLKNGAEVAVLGTPVGTVKHIDLTENNQLRATLKIRGASVNFIKTDSIAVIKRKLGVTGDAFVDITTGANGDPIAQTGTTVLDCRTDAELMAIAQDVIEQVQQAALPAITELQKTLMEFRLLAADIRNPEGNIQQILAQATGTLSHVESILASVDNGEGPAGMLLKDPATADQISTMLTHLEASSAVLPEIANTVSNELVDVPGTVLQARATLYSSDQLLRALSHNWFINLFNQKNNSVDTIPIDAVQNNTSGEVSQ